jgi:hypothetical protein
MQAATGNTELNKMRATVTDTRVLVFNCNTDSNRRIEHNASIRTNTLKTRMLELSVLPTSTKTDMYITF